MLQSSELEKRLTLMRKDFVAFIICMALMEGVKFK